MNVQKLSDAKENVTKRPRNAGSSVFGSAFHSVLRSVMPKKLAEVIEINSIEEESLEPVIPNYMEGLDHHVEIPPIEGPSMDELELEEDVPLYKLKGLFPAESNIAKIRKRVVRRLKKMYEITVFTLRGIMLESLMFAGSKIAKIKGRVIRKLRVSVRALHVSLMKTRNEQKSASKSPFSFPDFKLPELPDLPEFPSFPEFDSFEGLKKDIVVTAKLAAGMMSQVFENGKKWIKETGQSKPSHIRPMPMDA